MSDTNEKTPGAATPGANTESHAHAPIMTQNTEAAKNNSEVIKALNNIASTLESLLMQIPEAPSYANELNGITLELADFVRVARYQADHPTFPAGPNDWVCRVYAWYIEADTQMYSIETAVLPIIGWCGCEPIVAMGFGRNAYREPPHHYDLVLKNGVDIQGTGLTKEEYFKEWEHKTSVTFAILRRESLPVGLGISSLVSAYFDEAIGGDFPESYNELSQALHAKNSAIWFKLVKWGYTKEVHATYVASWSDEPQVGGGAA